jgi:hypothetical protein
MIRTSRLDLMTFISWRYEVAEVLQPVLSPPAGQSMSGIPYGCLSERQNHVRCS